MAAEQPEEDVDWMVEVVIRFLQVLRGSNGLEEVLPPCGTS